MGAAARSASRDRETGKTCLIGVDVGGTKILVGAVEARPDGVTNHLIMSEHVATPHVAPTAFYDGVATLVRQMDRKVQQRGWRVLPLVTVAHPGRFAPGGTLARGTTPNLGTAPGQFDSLRPAEELQHRLGVVVVAENDAIAQMRYGLRCVLRDARIRPCLLDHTVIYLGPGTGMGGGVARVNAEGVVTPITDGHLFDVQVSGYRDGTLTAEELFTGQAMARRLTEVNRHLRSPILPATARQLSQILATTDPACAQWHVACQVADEHGDILASLIETIHAGRITKVRLEPTPDGGMRRHLNEPDRAWPPTDHAAVRGARRFLLGGSIGADPALGGRIRARALDLLTSRGLVDVKIIQLPMASPDAGLLGVVTAIPMERVRAVMAQTPSGLSGA